MLVSATCAGLCLALVIAVASPHLGVSSELWQDVIEVYGHGGGDGGTGGQGEENDSDVRPNLPSIGSVLGIHQDAAEASANRILVRHAEKHIGALVIAGGNGGEDDMALDEIAGDTGGFGRDTTCELSHHSVVCFGGIDIRGGDRRGGAASLVVAGGDGSLILNDEAGLALHGGRQDGGAAVLHAASLLTKGAGGVHLANAIDGSGAAFLIVDDLELQEEGELSLFGHSDARRGSVSLNCDGNLSASRIRFTEQGNGTIWVLIGNLEVRGETELILDGTEATDIVIRSAVVHPGGRLVLNSENNGGMTLERLYVLEGGSVAGEIATSVSSTVMSGLLPVALPEAGVGVEYKHNMSQYVSSNGNFELSLKEGESLPRGLYFDPTDWSISGTPVAAAFEKPVSFILHDAADTRREEVFTMTVLPHFSRSSRIFSAVASLMLVAATIVYGFLRKEK